MLDAWAAANGVAPAFTVRGVGWWSHARGFIRLQVHELLMWRAVLDELVPQGSDCLIEVVGTIAFSWPPRLRVWRRDGAAVWT